MKKLVLFCLLLSATDLIHSNGIFLWEYLGNGQRSCCLHIANTDICNPDVACTRTVTVDLLGIYDYIGRILGMEKSSGFPFYELLKQAQIYIQRAWSTSMCYRYDYYVSNLKFYHELAAEAISSKNEKGKTNATSSSTTEKAKQDDALIKYLMKLGLAKQVFK